MNQTLLISLTLSLIMTIMFETGFFLVIGKRNKKDILLVILVNVITNPVVVLLHWLAASYTDWNMILILIPLELSAILVEGYYYKKYGGWFNRPYLFSTAANIFSFGTGALIQILI